MKKFLLTIIALMLAFWMLPTYSSAKVEDGIYSLNYQVNKAGTISASIANDYFAKPAKLFVENGKMRMQLTIKQSAWVTKFDGPHGGNKVIGENKEANTRLVEFNVTDIQNVTVIKMNVDIDEMNYHHTYSTDFVWDSSSLKLLEATKKPEPKAAEPVQEEVKNEEPKAVVEPKPAAAPASAPAAQKVEEKPAAVVKTESKPAAEQKPAEVKPVEEKTEALVEKAAETKVVEDTVTEEKAAEATKEEPAVKAEGEKVTVANGEEATVEKEVTTSLIEEAETANAPAEAKSSSSAWIYIVIALLLAGAAVLFMRKRSSANKA